MTTVNVARQCHQIDLEPRKHAGGHLRQFRQAIQMRVAEMEDAVSVEGGREIGKEKVELDQARRQCVAPAGSIEPAQARGDGEGTNPKTEQHATPVRPRPVGTDVVAAPLHDAAALRPNLALRSQ